MIYVHLPNADKRILPFYLAMEEHIARRLPPADYFFMWQVEPSVIFGRNQLIASEVNVAYCQSHAIGMYRRKSGGGCVYADEGNIMLSYITSDDNVWRTYNKYITLLLSALRRIGITATASGRNDVMIDGRKVSGNAFYRLPGRSIVHGTMLYDTDIANMQNALTPSSDKLRSKGVASIRQHITTIRSHYDISINDFKAALRKFMCDKEMTLTTEDIRSINDIERSYLTDTFIYGNNPRYNVTQKGRIDGVGDLVISLEMKENVIKNIDFKGDFFLTGDIQSAVIQPLINVPLEREALSQALPDDLSDIIKDLHTSDLINILLQ